MHGRTIITLAAILGGLAVAIGAFGAHALPGWLKGRGIDEATLQKREVTFETGARYHTYHALALLAVGILQLRHPSRMTTAAAIAMIVGIAFFSGNLYIYALTGNKAFAMIVPLGGLSFIIGWACLVGQRRVATERE